MSEQAITADQSSTDLLEELAWAGLEVSACYQCGRCSSGCPLSAFFDLLPMEVVRLGAYGQEEPLLKCSTIWLCASCETCTTRCPNDIDIAGVMDLLRERTLARGLEPSEKRVALFHHSFLRSVRRWGRTYELGLLGSYKMRSGDLFGDMKLGMAMFKRGKIKLLPKKIRHQDKVRALFDREGKKRSK